MLEKTIKWLPVQCPSCGRKLTVRRLSCQGCGTQVEGTYELPALARLSKDDQEFILQFVSASGSLKEMATLMNVSYPTIRNRLDGIIENLKRGEAEQVQTNG